MIVLTLPSPPSGNLYWRHRVMTVNGRPMPQVYISAEAKEYREAVALYARSVGIRQALVGRVWVDIQLHPQRPKDWATRMRKDPLTWDDSVKRIDLDNARKVLNDALQGCVISSDAMIFRDSGEVCEPDQWGARVVVTIRQIVRKTPQQGLDIGDVP